MNITTEFRMKAARHVDRRNTDPDALGYSERIFRCGAGCASLLIPLVAAAFGDGLTHFLSDVFPLLPPLLAASIYAIFSGISGRR